MNLDIIRATIMVTASPADARAAVMRLAETQVIIPTEHQTAYFDAVAHLSAGVAPKSGVKAAALLPYIDTIAAIVDGMAGKATSLVSPLAVLTKRTLPARPKSTSAAARKCTDQGDWDWVAGASPERGMRTVLRFVLMDGQHMVATDGHRLHMVKRECEHPALLHPVTGQALWAHPLSEADLTHQFAPGQQYFDWARAVPNYEDTVALGDITAQPVLFSIRGVKPTTILTFPGGRQVFVNSDYWRDATHGAPDDAQVGGAMDAVYGHPSTRAVRVTHGTRTAVVMPVRYETDDVLNKDVLSAFTRGQA